MAKLREMLADLGYGDVSTHLQSGNAVFTSPGSQRGPWLARSSLASRAISGVTMTVRSRRTVTKLAELAAGMR
jgi:uncharacterized protein (DUF1697 family)